MAAERRTDAAPEDPGPRRALLRALTDAAPGFAVWKHGDRAWAGQGDVDAVLPAAERTAALEALRAWAPDAHARAIVVCRHVPATTVGVAVLPGGALEQVDLVHRFVLHAAELLAAGALARAAAPRPEGFRALRPGAEGTLRLLREELRAGGRLPVEAPEPVRGLLLADREGAELVVSQLGRAAGPARRLVEAAAGGGWDGRAAAALELAVAARVVRDVPLAAACARFDLRRRRCSVLEALAGGRRVEGALEPWLLRVARDHEVVPVAPR